MNQKQANILTELWNLLDTLDTKKYKFNLETWIDKDNFRNNFGDKDFNKKDIISCGTTCCAVGWAALLLPSWQKHIKFNVTGDLYILNNKEYDTLYGLSEFLGVSTYYIKSMFFPNQYFKNVNNITKKNVCKRIEEVLNRYNYDLV